MIADEMNAASNAVPLSRPLGAGQRDSHDPKRDKQGTGGRTVDLKALASAVLARDKVRDSKGTAVSKPVPLPVSSVGQPIGQRAVTDWQEYFNERAGIIEHDGKQARTDSERMAFEHCITRWLDTHSPKHSDAARCPYCNNPRSASGLSFTPAFAGQGSYLWVHKKCLERWQAERRKEAINGLRDMGIVPPMCIDIVLFPNDFVK